MSLNEQEMTATREAFQQNLNLSGLSLEEIAHDLHTTTAVIADTLTLNVSRIEDPWVLKNYLEEQLHQQGKTPFPFTALKGDYHQYWFLNSRRIDRKKIG